MSNSSSHYGEFNMTHVVIDDDGWGHRRMLYSDHIWRLFFFDQNLSKMTLTFWYINHHTHDDEEHQLHETFIFCHFCWMFCFFTITFLCEHSGCFGWLSWTRTKLNAANQSDDKRKEQENLLKLFFTFFIRPRLLNFPTDIFSVESDVWQLKK